jgi:cytochrome c5
MKTLIIAVSTLGLLGASATAMADGKATYTQACAACHAAGVAGSPKLGDKAAWKARIAQGKDTLYEHAIKGFKGKAGFMPAKGGRADLSDDAVKAAVDYMVSEAK